MRRSSALCFRRLHFSLTGAERAVASFAAGGSKSDALAERVLHRLREDSPSWFDTFSARVRAEGKRGSEGFTVFDGVIPSSSSADLGVKLRDGVWSASVLNEVARCRFHYFAGRILGAQSPDMQDEALSPLERGT